MLEAKPSAATLLGQIYVSYSLVDFAIDCIRARIGHNDRTLYVFMIIVN